MAGAPLSTARRRIVERLQRLDGATAADLAQQLGLTGAAIRQHLDGLAELGLVAS
nr:helix-turn-helix domain-containing protein [Actinomycetota bacterium]